MIRSTSCTSGRTHQLRRCSGTRNNSPRRSAFQSGRSPGSTAQAQSPGRSGLGGPAERSDGESEKLSTGSTRRCLDPSCLSGHLPVTAASNKKPGTTTWTGVGRANGTRACKLTESKPSCNHPPITTKSRCVCLALCSVKAADGLRQSGKQPGLLASCVGHGAGIVAGGVAHEATSSPHPKTLSL